MTEDSKRAAIADKFITNVNVDHDRKNYGDRLANAQRFIDECIVNDNSIHSWERSTAPAPLKELCSDANEDLRLICAAPPGWQLTVQHFVLKNGWKVCAA